MHIGNGKRASFWYDSWTTLGAFSDLSVSQGHIALGIPNHATVHHASSIHRRRRHRSGVLSDIMNAACSVFSEMRPSTEDKDLWKFQESTYKHSFNSNQTWKLIRQGTAKVEWSSAIWFPLATPKYSFITWLACLDRLSTGDRIASWTSPANIICRLCGCIVESRSHLFFICKYSFEIWKSVLGNLIHQPAPQTWDSAIHLIRTGSTTYAKTFLLRYTFQTMVYHIWRERNSRRHGSKPSPPSLLVKIIRKNVTDRISSLQCNNEDLHTNGLREWSLAHRQ